VIVFIDSVFEFTMADTWAATDLVGALIAGTANGYILVNMSNSFNNGMLALFLGGIVAYAGAKIILRIVKMVFMPGTNTNAKFTDLFAVKNWPHFIVWGGINGITFALLYPMVGRGTMGGVLLGTATFFAANIFGYLLAF